MKAPKQPSGWTHYYRMIRRIPFGKVSTYGAIAEFAGHPRSGRHVGYALAALRSGESDVPWHRVLGARSRTLAKVSIKDPMGGGLQRAMLEAEGVEFDARGNVSLSRFGWTGPKKRKAPAKKAQALRPKATKLSGSDGSRAKRKSTRPARRSHSKIVSTE